MYISKLKRFLLVPLLFIFLFSFTATTLTPISLQKAYAAPDTTAQDAQNTNTQESYDSNCRASLSPFGWVLCPLIVLADNLYTGFVSLVNKLLFFGSGNYNTSSVKEIWRSFVVIANSVLVLLAMVMIVSQIFSFEFFSAYSVKKILPRLIIGAILIQLSWVLCTLMIDIVNAIGAGLYWLILAPFSKYNDVGSLITLRDVFRFYSSDTTGAREAIASAPIGVLSWLAGAAALSSLYLLPGLGFAVALFAIGVVVGIVIAIFTLVVRQSLLVILLAMAPLGIAFWILPGTNKLWNLWWGSFSKLLMMYPLIMLLFASGTVAATILAGTGDGMGDLLAVVSFYAPIFLIGATFKFAGTALGAVAGYVAGAGKKIGDSGFGLRRQKEIYDKARTDMKGREMADKQLKFARDAFQSDNPIKRARARAIVGGAALIPGWKRGDEKLETARNRYESIADEEEMKKSGEIWTGLTRTIGKKDRKRLQEQVAGLKEGQESTFKYEDAKGNEQSFDIVGSEFLTRHALSSAVTDGNTAAYKALLNNADEKGNDLGEAERVRREKIHASSMTKDGNYGALDALDPTLSRAEGGKALEVMGGDIQDLTLSNFDTLKGEGKDTTGATIKSDNKTGVEGIQIEVARKLGSKIAKGGDEERAGMAQINDFFSKQHKSPNAVSALQREVVNAVPGLTPDQIDSSLKAMELVVAGKGSSMLRRDPKTGAFIAVTTSIPAPTQTQVPNPPPAQPPATP